MILFVLVVLPRSAPLEKKHTRSFFVQSSFLESEIRQLKFPSYFF